jgi:hypothetical protein
MTSSPATGAVGQVQTESIGSAAINPWRVLAWVGVIVMESTWLTLIFGTASPRTLGLSLPAIYSVSTGLLIFYFLAEYRITRYDLSLWTERLAHLLIFAAATLVGVLILFSGQAPAEPAAQLALLRFVEEIAGLLPTEWLFALFSGLVFWRGATLARQGVGTFAVIRHLKFGVAAYIFFSILAFSQRLDLPGIEFFILFMFGTLLALSTARVSVLARFRGGRRSPFNRSWVASMALAIFGTMGVGISIAMLFTGRLFTFWRQVFTLLFGALVGLIMAPFIFLVSLFADTSVNAFAQPTPTPAPRFLSPFEEDLGYIPRFVDITPTQTAQAPPGVLEVIYFGSVILAIAFLVIVIWRLANAIRRRRPRGHFEYAVAPTDWLAYLRRRAKQAGERGTPADTRTLGKRGRLRAAAQIRQVYADLMDAFEQLDLARTEAQTPLEFLPTMQGRLAGHEGEFALITDSYLKIRYGELPENRAEVDAVHSAWKSIRAAALPQIERLDAQKKAEARARKRREQIA